MQCAIYSTSSITIYQGGWQEQIHRSTTVDLSVILYYTPSQGLRKVKGPKTLSENILGPFATQIYIVFYFFDNLDL